MVGVLVLAVLFVFTLAALAGFATFGQHPELLVNIPNATAVYAVAFTLFARAQVAIAFITLAVALAKAGRLRWVPAFGAVYALSLASELLGTTVGLPFGPYQYTPSLGFRWFGHVPVLIPLSWFTMAVPSLALAARLGARGAWVVAAGSSGTRLRRDTPRAARALLIRAALILLTWDLALDPAMSRVTSYWVWGNSGPYYGMPWLNLFGWFVTGLAIMAVLARLGALDWTSGVSTKWLAAFYAINLALPMGMNAAAGNWGAVGATTGALLFCASLGIVLTRNVGAPLAATSGRAR